MGKIFEVNCEMLFSGTHLVKTEKGLVEAQNLKEGDILVGIENNSEITGIKKYVKNLDTPFVSATNKQ